MTATDFNNRIRFGSLYEIYGALLTKKQQQCLELYFCEDYSLAEIAEEMQVSRQAIHDLLKRVEQTLEHYEEMLGFLQRMEKTRVLTEEAEKLLDTVAVGSRSAETGRSDKAKAILDSAVKAGKDVKDAWPGNKERNEKLARLREILQELQEEGR